MNRQERMMMSMQQSKSQPQAPEQVQRVQAGRVSMEGEQQQQTALAGQPQAAQAAQARAEAAGNQARYREEYGFKLTKDQYEEYQGAEKDWNDKLAGYSDQLATGQKEIDTVRGQLEAEKKAKEAEIGAAQARLDEVAKKSIKDVYGEAKKAFIPVSVVSGKENQIEHTYHLPQEVLGELQKGLKETYRFQNFGPDGHFYIGTKFANGGDRGKELHEQLIAAEKEIETGFIEKAMPGFQKQREEIRTGYDTLNSARAGLINYYNSTLGTLYGNETGIKTKQMEIDTARKDHQGMLDGYKSDYAERLKGRRALMRA